jgi:hypothetical protein
MRSLLARDVHWGGLGGLRRWRRCIPQGLGRHPTDSVHVLEKAACPSRSLMISRLWHNGNASSENEGGQDANRAALVPIAASLVKRVPVGATIQLQTLYGSLTPEERRLMRRGGYPSLLSFLKDQHQTSGELIALSSDGLRATKLNSGSTSDPMIQRLLNPVVAASPKQPQPNLSHKFAQPISGLPVDTAGLTENLWEVFEPPLVASFSPPPAPEWNELSKSERRVASKVGAGHAGVFTAEMLVPYLPTFFVPISELLQVLPEGYTAEHIEGIFTGTKTVEVVTLEGEKFVRMHGGYTVNLSQSVEANMRFPQYEPDPTLCDLFSPLFERPYRWYPLRSIVEGVPPLAAQRLPFSRYKSLLFFAQMQHRFQFAADGQGELCAVENGDHLGPHNTPTPQALSEVMELLREHEGLSADELVESLSRNTLILIVLYYRGLQEFLSLHSAVFEVCPVRRLVELRSTAEARRRKNRSLEEKLEDAIAKNEKRDVRKIRRKLAIARNPNNPLLDREHLILEVKKFLPRTRNISFRALLRNIPPDVVDLFPSDQISLFRTSPQHFQVFEYKIPGRLHIMRAGLPLPPGHLRQHYTEEELIHLSTMHLVHHPRLMVDIYSRLPWGAREIVRVQYKGLFQLLAKYPQYFAIVFKDGKQKYDARGAMVSLVGQPPPIAMDDETLLMQSAGSSPPQALIDEDEEIATREVRRHAEELGYKPPQQRAPTGGTRGCTDDGEEDDESGPGDDDDA